MGQATENAMLIGATTPHVFFNPQILDGDQADLDPKGMLKLRKNMRHAIMVEEERVTGLAKDAANHSAYPGPTIQFGSYRMKDYNNDFEAGRWYSQSRLPLIGQCAGMHPSPKDDGGRRLGETRDHLRIHLASGAQSALGTGASDHGCPATSFGAGVFRSQHASYARLAVDRRPLLSAGEERLINSLDRAGGVADAANARQDNHNDQRCGRGEQCGRDRLPDEHRPVAVGDHHGAPQVLLHHRP